MSRDAANTVSDDSMTGGQAMDAPVARRLARGGLCLSEIGFGAAPIGNLYRPMSDDEARSTIEAGLAAGLTYVDTAPHYGAGLSERRLGEALAGRDGIVLSSKVGRLLEADSSATAGDASEGFHAALPFRRVFDYSYEGVLRSHEESLHRLGVSRIDILYVHDIGRVTHGDDHDRTFDQLTRGGGFRALDQLRREGAISAFGLGVNEWQICIDAMEHADLDVVLLAGRYTLLEQGALDRFLPSCLQRGVSVVIGGAYNSGILASGTRRPGPHHYNYAPAPPEIIHRVRRLEEMCDRFEVSLAAAALQFPLAHPAVVSVIPGLDSGARVDATLSLYHEAIPAAFWKALREDGLIHGEAPHPGEAA
jgi:D-threo-aldose 1-dehydrogenase